MVQEVDRAVAFADAGHDEPVSELSRFVMSEAAAGIGAVR